MVRRLAATPQSNAGPQLSSTVSPHQSKSVAIVLSHCTDSRSHSVLGVLTRQAGNRLAGRLCGCAEYVSWIHYKDFVRALYWLIEHDDVEGAVNVASPNPLPNAAFMRTLRDACGLRIGLPATAWMLEVGAILLRTETELILKSRRVVPGRLLQQGFSFRYPTWPEAAHNLCDEWRRMNRRRDRTA